MQQDAVLRIPKCSAMEIIACQDPLSEKTAMNWENGGVVVTDTPICSLAVPGACPRVQCMKEGSGYRSCRMLSLIESQENESGFWMRLPCGTCPETQDLHPTTKGFVYNG